MTYNDQKHLLEKEKEKSNKTPKEAEIKKKNFSLFKFKESFCLTQTPYRVLQTIAYSGQSLDLIRSRGDVYSMI